MENKSSKSLIWVCVILVIIIVALGSFIGYKTIFSDDKCDACPPCQGNDKGESSSIASIKDYPTSNSDNIKSYDIYEVLFEEDENRAAFVSETITLEGINFNFTCTKHYEEDGQNVCDMISVNVPKLESESETTVAELYMDNDNLDMIIYEDYIIFQRGSGYYYAGNIDIYKTDGTYMKSIGRTVKAYKETLDADEVDTNMRLIDGKLYFVESLELEDAKIVDLRLKYISFNDDLNEHTVDKFTGVIHDNS